jgi:hypothetical protein
MKTARKPARPPAHPAMPIVNTQPATEGSLRRHGSALLLVFWAASIWAASIGFADHAAGADPLPPLSQRFCDAATDEIPDFQKHIVPLLGRLGCNGRACHGSFQGRGGFQLSLFGYDFKSDYQSLLDAGSGRVDPDDVDQSLILVKPTDADQHEGGKLFDQDSWQQRVLRTWIAAGANFKPAQIQALVKLEVTPQEINFNGAGDTVALKVIADWEDGSREDVTELCRFQSNDDEIAIVDPQGRVEAAECGDTHVVVSFDNAVVPIPVIRPFESRMLNSLTRDSHSPLTHPIDRLVQQKLDKLNIQPSGRCSDADFVRRAALDISGVLPSPDTVREFLAESALNKREKLIDSLLDSPGYAAWWATRFSDWTGNNEEQLSNALPVRDAAGRLWYEWLRSRIADNVPYDQIAAGIVLAESRQHDESYFEYCEAMTAACQPGNEAQFASRDGLPMFWSRRDFQKPEERAIGFAYTFLGVRIECAQCHKHPFDRWSKEDFDGFAKLFLPIRSNAGSISQAAKDDQQQMIMTLTGGQELKGGQLRNTIYDAAEEGKIVPFAELLINTRVATAQARRAARQDGRKEPMKIPAGRILGELTTHSLDIDTRPALMEWLRSPDNPYFAKAIVNRVWSNYFGSGIVNPTDDMNLANPPSNAPLLNYLATEFIQHGYDLKWLHREILTSDTYQRSTQPNETNATDHLNFARHVPRRLPAEVLYDCSVLATASDVEAERLRRELHSLAIANGKPRTRNNTDHALTVFGTSIRESNCDCDRSDDPNLLQSIYLRNDREIHARLRAGDGWVAQACAALGTDAPRPLEQDRNQAALRRATAVKDRFVDRVEKFKQRSVAAQTKLRPQLRQDYNRTVERLRLLGYDAPALGMLLKLQRPWKELEPLRQRSPRDTDQTIEQIVVDAYLRSLSRFPDPSEMEISLAHLHQSASLADGLESLLWALINTKEFIITH